MRWLLHGSLTTAAAEALLRHGHVARTYEEAELKPDATVQEALAAAQLKQLDVITADPTLARATFSEGAVPFGRSVVFLNVPSADEEQDDAIDRLFARYPRLTPGRLYTVTASRVKVRQLPEKQR